MAGPEESVHLPLPHGPPPNAPHSHCPFCGSSDIASTGKVVSEASYWRCSACGEVWNPVRLRDSRYR